MPHVIATDRAMFWAVGSPIVAAGTTEVGEATLTGLSLIANADEMAFLEAVADETLSSEVPQLPAPGEWCEAGALYVHAGSLLICRQSHARTEHNPADVPALFIVWREDAPGLDWIAGERVYIGTQRLHAGIEYRCLQAHVTQADWPPPNVPALWRKVVPPGAEWQPYVAYAIGAEVTYAGVRYRCRQAHTSLPGWEPPNVLALWLPI